MKDLKSQLIDWLETKPADEEYRFLSITHCAIGQFGLYAGLLNEGECIGESDALFNLHVLIGGNTLDAPTFGALRDRLVQS